MRNTYQTTCEDIIYMKKKQWEQSREYDVNFKFFSFQDIIDVLLIISWYLCF